MENNKPLILISNDDGVISKGISALIRFLRIVSSWPFIQYSIASLISS